MAKSGIYILTFLLLAFPTILIGQNHDEQWYRTRSNELLKAGSYLNDQRQAIDALDSLNLALRYRQKVFGEENYYLGSIYMAMGISYKELGQNNKAIEKYKLSESSYLLRNDSNLVSLGFLYRNIGNVFREKLDYSNALFYNSQALKIFLSQRVINQEEVYDANYAIAEIYYLLKKYDNSLSLLKKYENQTDSFNSIYYLELTAIINQEIGKLSEANEYYLKNINLVKEYYGVMSLELAISYLNYGEFLLDVSKFEESGEILQNAYEIISQIQREKGVDLSRNYEFFGRLAQVRVIESENILSFKNQKRQNLQKALGFYRKSLQALYKGEGEVKIEDLTIQNTLSFMDCLILLKTIADTYNEIALLDREEKNQPFVDALDDALRYYSVIGNLIQTARKEISSDDSKRQLAELEYSTFTKTIETAFLAYDVDKADRYLEIAFQNSEQIKSSSVFDKISNDLAQENSLIPDSLIELENKLNSTISIYNEKIFEENSTGEPDSVLINEYNTKVFEASRKRDDLNRFLEENYPDYYELKYSNKMLSINDVQKKLGKREALIEYVLNESDSTSELFTLLLTSGSKHFFRQELSPEMLRAMEYMHHFMITPNYLLTQEEDSRRFVSSSNEMYQLLIQPIESSLKHRDLIIVPDGRLNYIAFDGLLKELPDTSATIDFSKLPYLIRDYSINYANSANIFFEHRRGGRSLRNAALAFAPEYNSENFVLSNASYTLLPLPGVQKEVEAISETIKTKILKGSEANEQNFRNKSSNFEILHLAMHAYINDSLPAFSRLAFSPVKSSDDLNNDGWLNTADIYNLDLRNTRLTVLSACNTGSGRMQKGEGLLSLSRGFLYAGCPSIVMSLWEVEDQAGTQIMTSFYKNLKHGKTKDEALRLAKLSYLENANSRLAHPHYWMGFKAIGDNSPIYASYDFYFFGILIALILFFSIDQWLRIKKARRKQQAS